jgi:hypothetical protein
MQSKYLLFLAIGILSTTLLSAQEWPSPCGTTGKTKWLIEYQKNRDAFATENDTNWLYVPITFTIVGTDNGAGYFPVSRTLKALCWMNSQYEPARIKCYLHPTQPFRYLNNSSWYEHDWNGGEQLITQNNLPGRVNAYIVSDPAGNCGYSWYDAIVLGKNCSSETNSTWGHELGHHLSLPHPFVGWEGRNVDPTKPAPVSLGWNNRVEKVDRSNCQDAADGFCDTEPDYISNRWNCNGDGKSFEMLDPDSVAFRADGSYIMGYANDGCQNRFMPDQIAAMRANLNTEHIDYLVTAQHGPILADDAGTQLISPIDSAQVQFNQATFTWNALPGASHYVLEIGLFGNFNPTIHTHTTTNTSYNYTAGLPKNRVLFWRVKAFSAWDVCEEQTDYQVGRFLSLDITATNELEKTYSVQLTPNPVASGRDLQLYITSDRTEAVQWSVYNLNGQLIASAPMQVYEGDQRVDIPTTACAAGTYRFVLQNERGLVSHAFVVFE